MTVTLHGTPIEPLVREQEIVRELGFKSQFLRHHRNKGTAPPFYRDGRSIFYKRSEVNAWLEAKRVVPVPVAKGE